MRSSLQSRYFHARVLENKPIADGQWSLWVKPEEGVFPSFLPGQFCMIGFKHLVDPLLPRPFAIVRRQSQGETYQFIYRVAGKFTQLLANYSKGQLLSVLGPLGQGIEEVPTRAVFVAGGIGYASLLPVIESFAQLKKPPRMTLFYGLRSELDRIHPAHVPEFFFSTDDGSLGYFGRIDSLMKEKEAVWEGADRFYVCGPTGMMKSLWKLLPPEKSLYFLEESMACGVGICMGCVVPLQTGPVRSCLEGTMFWGKDLQKWAEPESEGLSS